MRYGLWPGVVLLWMLASQSHAVDIDSLPFTISAPGTYNMTMDLDLPVGGGAIAIVSSGVLLDLGGHTLSGNFGAGGILVAGVSEVTVTNGIVSGFAGGITLDNASNCTVTGITASFNAVYGIGLQNNSSQNLLQGNTCNNGLTYGIQLVFSNQNTIVANTASDNFTAGIRMGGQGNVLNMNTANNNHVGILLQNANDSVLNRNTAGNNLVGIWLADSSGANTLMMNTTNANSNVGILVGTNGNTVRHNTAIGNQLGIVLEVNSSGNLVTKNTALNSDIYDLQDLNCDNTWTKNVFVISNGACIE